MVQSPMVGRAGELAALRAVLDDAAAGRPAIAVVGGDAGIGKSRLTTQLADEATARGFLVLTGQCVDLAGGVPYLPFSDLLRPPSEAASAARLRAAVDAQPALAPLTRGAAGGDVTDIGQLQLFGGFGSFLAGLSAAGPLLVLLEDLHWADRSSRDLLAFLCRTLRHESVALVVTYRSDDLHRRHPLRPLLAELTRLPGVTRVDLAPLSAAETLELLRGRTSTVPGDRLVAIAARAEGNPFWAEELLDAASHCVDGLTADIADVLLARLDRLGMTTIQLLRAASAAGHRVHHRLLLQVSGLDLAPYEEALREALAELLLVARNDETFAFRHALLQEAVYGELLPGERSRLHAAYADAIRADSMLGSPSDLAHHCLASHDIPGCLVASLAAAREAERSAAPAEAHQHLEQALAVFDRVPDAVELAGMSKPRLALRVAAAAGAAGDFSRAVALTTALLGELDPAGDPLLTAEVAERTAHYLLDGDGGDGALAAGELAMRLVPETPMTPLRARVLASMARNLVAHGRLGEARETSEAAVEAARAVGSADDEADALVSLALVAEHEGRDGDAVALLREARELVRRADNRPVELRVVYNLARVHYQAGALADAASRADMGVATAVRSGLQWSAFGTDLLVLQYFVRFLSGEWDEAVRLAAEHAADLRITSVASARLAVVMSHVDVARGNAAVSERLDHARQYEASDEQTRYLGNLLRGELCLQSGDFEGARHHLAAALETVSQSNPLRLATVRAAALAATAEADLAAAARHRGDDTAAAAAAAKADVLRQRCDDAVTSGGGIGSAVGAEALAWQAWAAAEASRATGASDAAAWHHAADTFAYGDRYQVARCRLREAEALLATGRRDEAAEVCSAAREVAVSLGAAPLVAALDQLRRRGRLDGVPAARTPAETALTAREIDVLALVSAGLSNKQIGERLFISTKTASVHVSNILAKLGANSRTEAAAIAQRTGLLTTE